MAKRDELGLVRHIGGRGGHVGEQHRVHRARAAAHREPLLIPHQQRREVQVQQLLDPQRQGRAHAVQIGHRREVPAQPAQRGAVLVAVLEQQAVDAQAHQVVEDAEEERGQQGQHGGEGQGAVGLDHWVEQPAAGGDGHREEGDQQSPEQAVYEPALGQPHIQGAVAQDRVGEAGRQDPQGQDRVFARQQRGAAEQLRRQVERHEG